MRSFKVIFFGSDEYSVAILDKLLDEKVDVVACVTKPDRAKKRNKITFNPVKKYLLEKKFEIPLFQPDKASTPDFVELMASYAPDLFVVVSYGEIISEALLRVPKILPVNLHPSFLPKYRGASPLRTALLKGDKKIGIALIEMVKAMDAGDILAIEEMEVLENENHSELEKRVFSKSANLLIEWIKKIDVTSIKKQKQLGEPTFTKKFSTTDRLLDFELSACEVLNKVRAFSMDPGAFLVAKIGNKKEKIKILHAVFVKWDSKIYEKEPLFTKQGWIVPCGSDAIKVLCLQRENKNPVGVAAFFNGLRGKFPVVEHSYF